MIKNRTFCEILALSSVLFTIWIPGGLFAFWSVKAGHFVDFPSGVTGFMAAANAIVLGLLGLSQFSNRTTTTTAAGITTTAPAPSS
jgi:hypothetical protein